MNTEQKVQVEVTKEELAIRQAIRDMKEQIKTLSLQQKEGKQEFRRKMSEWDKMPCSSWSRPHVPRLNDMGTKLTSLLIIYGQLRNRPHLSIEALEEYFNGIPGRYLWGRKTCYRETCQEFIQAHPETEGLIKEEVWK